MPTCAGSRTTPKAVHSRVEMLMCFRLSHSCERNRFFPQLILIDWDKLRTRQEYLANRRNAVGNELRPRFRGYFVLPVVLGILLFGLASQRAIAQTEKASVSGRVTD